MMEPHCLGPFSSLQLLPMSFKSAMLMLVPLTMCDPLPHTHFSVATNPTRFDRWHCSSVTLHTSDPLVLCRARKSFVTTSYRTEPVIFRNKNSVNPNLDVQISKTTFSFFRRFLTNKVFVLELTSSYSVLFCLLCCELLVTGN